MLQKRDGKPAPYAVGRIVCHSSKHDAEHAGAREACGNQNRWIYESLISCLTFDLRTF